MKWHVRVALQPSVILLVGVEIVEDDLDLLAGIVSDTFVQKGEELFAAAIFVRTYDFSGRHLEGGKQRRGSIALIVRGYAPLGCGHWAVRGLQRDRRKRKPVPTVYVDQIQSSPAPRQRAPRPRR